MHQRQSMAEPGARTMPTATHEGLHNLHLAQELRRLERQRQQLLQAAAQLARPGHGMVIPR